MRAYIFDTQTKTPRGDNAQAAVLESDDSQELEEQIYTFMLKHEPDHYRTTTKRYRVLTTN